MSKDALLTLSRAIVDHMNGLAVTSDPLQGRVRHLQAAAEGARPGAPVHGSDRYTDLVERCCRLATGQVTAKIASCLLPVQGALPWVYHYARRSATDDLDDRIAFAELIGPDGPLQAPACRVGFTIVAENTLYPLHAHPAVELYLVIAGRAHWRAGDVERSVPPGDLVLHRTAEPHAMRTGGEPLLALWGWSGDIDAPAVYL